MEGQPEGGGRRERREGKEKKQGGKGKEIKTAEEERERKDTCMLYTELTHTSTDHAHFVTDTGGL